MNGCSGGAGDPLGDGGIPDAAIDHKLGVSLDAGADVVDGTADASCASLGAPDAGGVAKSCEPVDDSFCSSALACGDALHTNHYRCDTDSAPFSDPLGVNYHCLDFGSGDYCCERRDCVYAVDHATCGQTLHPIACWPSTSPGDAGTGCSPTGDGDNQTDNFFCCVDFEPSP